MFYTIIDSDDILVLVLQVQYWFYEKIVPSECYNYYIKENMNYNGDMF